MSNHHELTTGFIGGGNMAQAIIRGLLKGGHKADRISVSDPSEDQLDAIAAIDSGIELTDDNTRVANSSDLLVLAVKPQVMAQVATSLNNTGRHTGQIIVSVAAGITLQSMRGWFGDTTPVVRVMPNQPALIGAGMSGLCATTAVDKKGKEAVGYLMSAAGQAVWFEDEHLMDAVTAISGSGPAYFYLIMEIMQDVAREFGFDTETARLLSTQTAFGAGCVAANSNEGLALLRQRVTSPGGTTAAALASLEQAGIRDIFRRALIAARDRSVELGQPDK